jgi:putative flippase GtrA
LPGVQRSSTVVAHVLIGGVSVSVDVLLLLLLHRVVGLALATVLAFGASVVVNFVLNRALHLRGERSHRQVLRYAGLLAVNAAVTVGIVTAGHEVYLEAKLLAVAITTTWNLPLYRRWVFA